jgi:hypothetical protein
VGINTSSGSPSSSVPTGAEGSHADNSSFLPGLLFGLVPLAPLALTVALALGLAWLARQVTSSAGFYTQQWTAGIVVALGLLAGVIVFIVFSRRALSQIKQWQQEGQVRQAGAALWGLVIVALIVLLPLVLTIAIPQHPAPILTH